MSKTTKKCRNLFIIFLAVSILLNIAPIAIYSIMGLIQAEAVVEKVALSSTIFITLILSAIGWVNKTTMRSRVFIILIGLYICLDFMMTPLIIISICQILDEWIAAPLSKHYRSKLSINKELDKRLSV